MKLKKHYLVSDSAKGAEPPAVLEPEDLEGGGDDHPLLFVVGRGHSLEGLQTLQGQLAALSLVGDHSAHTSTEYYSLTFYKKNNEHFTYFTLERRLFEFVCKIQLMLHIILNHILNFKSN